LAAKSRRDVAAFATLQEHDHDQEEAHQDVQGYEQVIHALQTKPAIRPASLILE
jgi:hypothetical protein